MLKIARPTAFIALFLMAFLFLGSGAAQARDTHGADRLVKGAILGAGVGAVTQVVRGRRSGVQILKGAAVGGAVGAAVGAYSDYRQERNARYDDQRYYRGSRGYRDGYYRNGSYGDGYYPTNYTNHGHRNYRGVSKRNCR
jgi:YmgG-like glycine-zipper protein